MENIHSFKELIRKFTPKNIYNLLVFIRKPSINTNKNLPTNIGELISLNLGVYAIMMIFLLCIHHFSHNPIKHPLKMIYPYHFIISNIASCLAQGAILSLALLLLVFILYATSISKLGNIYKDLFFYITKLYTVFHLSFMFLAYALCVHVFYTGLLIFQKPSRLQLIELYSLFFFLILVNWWFVIRPTNMLIDQYNLKPRKITQYINKLYSKLLKYFPNLSLLSILTLIIFCYLTPIIYKYSELPWLVYNTHELHKEFINSPYCHSHCCQ